MPHISSSSDVFREHLKWVGEVLVGDTRKGGEKEKFVNILDLLGFSVLIRVLGEEVKVSN